MLSSFAAIAPHLRHKLRKISIDNLAFKFHYRATFIILLVCTILVTSRQYIGEHIRCITGGTIPEHVINTFCFFTTTFTVIRHLNESQLQSGLLPHPGIGPLKEDDPIRHHAYYQWVPFILFAQAMMFYLPHNLWRSWEGGKIKALVDGLQMISLSRHVKTEEDLKINKTYTLPSQHTVDGRVRRIKAAFLQHIRVNRFWASRLIICEHLNLLNLIIQVAFTNRFLGGQFYSLGVDFIRDDFDGIMDSLDMVFPKVTKCHFYKYGASGTIQKLDALCVMALNVMNEKIFIFLWFWYIVLAFVSCMALLWRITTMILHARSTRFNGFVFSMACPGRLNPWDMLTVTQHSSFSDWLFLYYLAKNMEPYLFRDMLIDLANELRQSDTSDNELENKNGDDEYADSDDEEEDYVGRYRNDKVTANENDKNDEVDKMLLSHEKK